MDASNTTTKRQRGRPAGSIEAVIEPQRLSMDVFTAVKSYLQGISALDSCRRYVMRDDLQFPTELSAFRFLAGAMLVIANAGTSRQEWKDRAAQEASQRASDALRTLALHIEETYKKESFLRLAQLQAQRKASKASAKSLNLVLLDRSTKTILDPHLPHHLASLAEYERHKGAEDDESFFDRYEDAKFAWYAERGYFYTVKKQDIVHSGRQAATALLSFGGIRIDHSLKASAFARIEHVRWTVRRLPHASDLVGVWLGGSTAKALKSADIFTLYQVIDVIRRHGAAWWKTIPSLGPVKAERVVDWLMTVGVEGAQLTVEDSASKHQRRAIEVARYQDRHYVPDALWEVQLEPWAPYLTNKALNGDDGIFRSQGPSMLGATNDIDAILAVLGKYKDKRPTLLVYSREICRFGLWCFALKRIPLSSVGLPEAREFREFLNGIPSDWISNTADAPPRGSKEWRPFRGQLDGASQRKALTSINVIFRALMESGYIIGNPFAGVLKHSLLSRPKMDVFRSFDMEQWSFICQQLDTLAPSPSSRRTHALVHLLCSTGLRRQEVFNARLGSIRREMIDGESAYILSVVGKRAKERDVFIPSDVLSLVEEHLADCGYTPDHDRSKIPLICAIGLSVKTHQAVPSPPLPGSTQPRYQTELRERMAASEDGALGVDGMATVLRRFMRQCLQAAHREKRDRRFCEAFEEATLHWFRHTFGHATTNSGVDLRGVQMALGHANINTTAVYSKTNLAEMVRGLRSSRGSIAKFVASEISTESPTAILPPRTMLTED